MTFEPLHDVQKAAVNSRFIRELRLHRIQVVESILHAQWEIPGPCLAVCVHDW